MNAESAIQDQFMNGYWDENESPMDAHRRANDVIAQLRADERERLARLALDTFQKKDSWVSEWIIQQNKEG